MLQTHIPTTAIPPFLLAPKPAPNQGKVDKAPNSLTGWKDNPPTTVQPK